MIALLLVLVSALAVLGAGEAVRSQCRRMLQRPLAIGEPLSPSGRTPATESVD